MTSKPRRLGKSALQQTYDGPGSPVYLMVERVGRLLRRMRNTLPFPVPIDLFLMTVYPEQLFLPNPRLESAPWRNLAASLNMGEIAHFGVEGRGEHDTFWVRHPKGIVLPVPGDASVTLTFDKTNPHFPAVCHWLNEALSIQFDLVAIAEKANDFIRTAKDPRHIEHYWPELYACVVAAMGGKGTGPPPKINTRALELPIKRTRDEITTMLTKCSMLPDLPCQAWVQYPRET